MRTTWYQKRPLTRQAGFDRTHGMFRPSNFEARKLLGRVRRNLEGGKFVRSKTGDFGRDWVMDVWTAVAYPHPHTDTCSFDFLACQLPASIGNSSGRNPRTRGSQLLGLPNQGTAGDWVCWGGVLEPALLQPPPRIVFLFFFLLLQSWRKEHSPGLYRMRTITSVTGSRAATLPDRSFPSASIQTGPELSIAVARDTHDMTDGLTIPTRWGVRISKRTLKRG